MRAHVATRIQRVRGLTVRAHVAVSLGLLAALAAPAAAADRQWATVNVCDTAEHPNEVGVRAAMPGAARGISRQVRFRLQWRDGNRWRGVDTADSGWRRIKSAPQYGWSFELAPPASEIEFRGVRALPLAARRGDAPPRAVEVTEAGHRSKTGADPEGYSAATCSMATETAAGRW